MKQSKRHTILFDLDGTLLQLDFDKFLKEYFTALTTEFNDLAESDDFIKVLMAATQEMIENDGQQTNQEVFMDSFFSMVQLEDRAGVIKRFDKFYQQKFSALGERVESSSTVIELVELLKDLGYNLAITTNPLFPKEAIIERINWAGLDPTDFELITSYEDMHYAKPNLNYFKEVMDRLEVESQECILVGNDLQEDIIAGKLGIKTFLIEDYLIDRETEQKISPDWRGSLVQFKKLVETKF